MMKTMHRVLILTLLCLALLGLTGAASATSTTVMMYMCGTDLQEDCLTDIKEMASASYGSDVKVVVLAGGAKKWNDSSLTRGKLNLFTVANGSKSSVENWGSASMGSPDTLKRFVTYCWNNHHSDRNILIMWDHGSSATAGMCFDEVHNDDSLQLTELESVFSQLSTSLNGFHLNIIGADACLMASYEMAATLAPYADYYVASEELEPYLGWYYTQWLTGLGQNPNMSDRDLAISIVDAYKYACEKDNPKDYLTLSVIDLKAMGDLTTHINSLASTLTNHLSGSDLSTISRTLQSCYVFGSFDSAGSDMIDLTYFINIASSYDSATASAATAALQKAVIYSYASSYVPSAKGMSIFIPMESSSELSSSIKMYSTSALSGYVGFVKSFASKTSSSSWSFSSSSNSSPSSVSGSDSGFWDSFWDYILDDDSDYDDYDECDDDGEWCGWDSLFGWGCDDWSCDYGSGYGNGCTLDIAGSGGSQGSSGSQGGSSFGGLDIAGSASVTPKPTNAPSGGLDIAGGSTPAPTQQPQAATATANVPSLAPTPVPTQAPSFDMTGVYAYSIGLSAEDIQYLSHAELLLFQDYSDSNGYDLDELGRVRNTWVDWKNNRIYALFDGTWPAIGNSLVVMYEQSRNEYGRRCIVPVMLNRTTRTYLVVEYTNGSEEGTILGTSQGWTENNLPVRGVTPLNIGDTITPIYPSYFSADTSAAPDLNSMSRSSTTYDDDQDFIVTWDGTQTVYQADLPEGQYKLAFRLYDIFGGQTTTSFVTFSLDD